MSLDIILSKVQEAEKKSGRGKGSVKVIAVSKVQPIERIEHVLNQGHRIFGENRVQETLRKWPSLIEKYGEIELHLVGSLQTNKVKDALQIFNVIHSVDREKLVLKIANEAQRLGHCPELFIQVNTGNEIQKAGINFENLEKLFSLAKERYSLPVVGLMCLPPINLNSDKFFKILKSSADKLNLKELSMGMSSDFENAVTNGSTFLRLGTLIMGERNII